MISAPLSLSLVSLISACVGFYSWYGQIKSVTSNHGRDLGKVHGNGLNTPFRMPSCTITRQAFTLESSREAKERSSTEHLDSFTRSRDQVHGRELVPAREGCTGQEAMERDC